MKQFGLIGGVGPESSVEYYRQIIKRYRERLNTKEYPEFVIHSINMTEMLGYVFSGRYDRLVEFLVDRIKVLEASGAAFAAIASNTPHIVFDELAGKVNIPLISIVEESCREIERKGYKKVGLLGTKSTMSEGFYQRVAERYGIEMVIPNRDAQDYVHDKYMNELVVNSIGTETKKKFLEIIDEMKEKSGIEGLVLGGTELPLLLRQDDFNDLALFDTTVIHVESIVSRMIGDR